MIRDASGKRREEENGRILLYICSLYSFYYIRLQQQLFISKYFNLAITNYKLIIVTLDYVAYIITLYIFAIFLMKEP